MGWSIVHVDDIEPAGPGGAVRFVRRELGARAFGINRYELGPNVVGREHDERESDQEEVNIVVRGSGTYRIDDGEVRVREGTFLRFDPETVRVPIAGPWADALEQVQIPQVQMSSGFIAIAPDGHSAAQIPQPLQYSRSIEYGARGSPVGTMALSGHMPKQLSQEKQLPQDRQRRASYSAVSASRPCTTSSNVEARRAASSSGRWARGASV